MEIHPVVEKQVRRFIFDVNPSIERALKGPAQEGWSMEPATRIRYQAAPRVTPYVEYYGFRESHHLLGGADIRIHENLSWSTGVGAGRTPAGNRLVYMTRIEFGFQRNRVR